MLCNLNLIESNCSCNIPCIATLLSLDSYSYAGTETVRYSQSFSLSARLFRRAVVAPRPKNSLGMSFFSVQSVVKGEKEFFLSFELRCVRSRLLRESAMLSNGLRSVFSLHVFANALLHCSFGVTSFLYLSLVFLRSHPLRAFFFWAICTEVGLRVSVLLFKLKFRVLFVEYAICCSVGAGRDPSSLSTYCDRLRLRDRFCSSSASALRFLSFGSTSTDLRIWLEGF